MKTSTTQSGTTQILLLGLGVTAVCVCAETLGAQEFKLGSFSLVLLPLFFAFVATLITNLGIGAVRPDAASRLWPIAGAVLQLLAVIFVARAGTVLGAALPIIIEAGPAVLLQSLGKIGTALLAFPVAMMLGFQRAAIGATFSIGREPSIALISERYGIGGPEGSGVLATYICGTLFGSLFFSVLAGLGAAIPIFSTTALAMACGVGSGGMTMSCAGSLAHNSHDLSQDDVIALATASDVLTYVTTIVLGAFVVLPVLERFSRRPRTQAAAPQAVENSARAIPRPLFLAAAAFICVAVVSAWKTGPSASQLVGLIVLLATAMSATTLGRRTSRYMPGVLWAAVIGALFTAPWLPWSGTMTQLMSSVDIMALATVALGWAGLVVTARQLKVLRTLSWRAVIVAFLVFAGSFFTSALLAQFALYLGGISK
ncbi:DUF3100 domain-containing protein [Kibdelosporangium philippinense]|uniref:DUF3100 domain-containing protein n=1 Tax=Kibdelosporangium philippinense TaxID=211113 RepID=A0ABS8Z750_9PSEU|nr:DUF3100 domain-containing protein [Kibdelosporangium philippinense]MCE7002403.1 DUF3100 domain-containing protein [Kibdelosporangium philippinense]